MGWFPPTGQLMLKNGIPHNRYNMPFDPKHYWTKVKEPNENDLPNF